MEKENQRIALTKRLLKESLLKLLKTKDLETISVTELCRDAEINRATFYRHYSIPKDLLAEIQSDLIHNMRCQVPLPHSQSELKQTLENLCRYMDENKSILRIIVKNNSEAELLIFIQDVYSELLKEPDIRKLFSVLNQEDIQLLALYSSGGASALLRYWLLGNIQKSPQELSSYLYQLIEKSGLLININMPIF